MTNTTEMSLELAAKLRQLGWNPERALWGRRVSGSPHGVEIEREGVTRYYTGPLTTVRVGDQIAIVRFG